jgi:hypothetical protein
MRHDLRSFVLRQAGLIQLSARVQGSVSSGIALIDGAVNLTHPALQGCRISKIGDSRSVRAGEHATFSASILVAGEADQTSSRVMGICSGCTVFNYAFVTDDMLTGTLSTREVARTLAVAVNLAVEANCQTIVFGIEIRHPESCEWRPLRESLRAALAAGAVMILPAGNRSGAPDATPCGWPEALVTASCDWRGTTSLFSPLLWQTGNTIFAPGENVPGAGPDSGYVVRSGTSFAAAIAAGAFGLATCLFPGRPVSDIAADLCRPPHRILNGTALFTKQFTCSETGGPSCNQ